jgi:hypothetical protein
VGAFLPRLTVAMVHAVHGLSIAGIEGSGTSPGDAKLVPRAASL